MSAAPSTPPANRGVLHTVVPSGGCNRVQNIVLYDWLSFTTKQFNVEQLIDVLGLSDCPWTITKGARGYQDRKYYGSISIHYNGRDDMGIWCEMSGQGCRTFESYSPVGWPALFDWVLSHRCNVTRLDVAYDDHTGILSMQDIVQDTMSGMWVSKSSKWLCEIGDSGVTVNIGSSKSDILIRIYDKAAERGIPDEHWVRCEMQLRDDRASAFLKLRQDIGAAFSGVIYNYLRYVDFSEEDSNRWRWPMKPYWSDLIQDAEKISLWTSPGTDYNEQRLCNYVFNLAGNAIDAALKMYGDQFFEMLKYRSSRPNPKYTQLIDEHERKLRMQRGI